MKKGDGPAQLDIREYLTAENFEGYTRRGVRISNRAQAEQLQATLIEILAGGHLSV